MKKLLLALALCLAPAVASAQCSGVFPANTVCGATTQAPPKPIASTSFPSGPITIGSTVISGGTTLRVLYDNGGVFGEYTNAQLTALMNLATASLSGALPAWPNNTTTFFRGDGSYATLDCAALTNDAPSCSTDTTNATNISSGTLGAARLPAFGSGDVSFASGGGAGTIANNAVTNAKAAQAGANTMKGNWTGSTANVADNAMPSCADSGGNHLNYVSGTGITCGSTSAGNGSVLLNTLTASGSASLSDTTSFTSSYSSYDIVFINVVPATNGTTCRIRINSGGVQTTTYLSTYGGDDSAGDRFGTSTTFIFCSIASATNNNPPGISGTFTLVDPSQTASPKMIYGSMATLNTVTPSIFTGHMAGYWNGGNGAVTGIQIDFDSGNITSGTVKIYGKV